MTGRPPVAITGRGVVSALGCDWPSFAAAVREGKPATLSPFPGSQAGDPPLVYAVPPEAIVANGKSREEPLSAMATAAARQALTEAGIPLEGAPLDDVGLVMSTVLGPSNAVETYLDALRLKGPRASRPAHFVDTLLSMPASRVGIAFRLRGSTAVLGGTSPFELALDWLRRGRARALVAGAGEYLSAKCARYLVHQGACSGAQRAPLAQAAAFVVLETAPRARERGTPAFGELLGAGGASEPQEVSLPWSSDSEGRAYQAAMRSALDDAGLSSEQIAAVALASADGAETGELAAIDAVLGPRSHSVRILRPKRQLGEALTAGGPLGLLAALATFEQGEIALVNAFEMGGSVSSIVVRAAQ